MAVGITVGSICDEIGAASFVHAFFSTISVHCEKNGWGTRFPHLMTELYSGRLPAASVGAALDELRQARSELRQLPATAVVWDIENRSAQPPWGTKIAPTIMDLSNYFVSSTGRDVFDLLDEALNAALLEKVDATLG